MAYEFGFNPLFIRSVFLLNYWIGINIYPVFKFQSLIHQVSVSFEEMQRKAEEMNRVSIPYSSGQCFFLEKFYTHDYDPAKFQSLIHQVSVSFPERVMKVFNTKEEFQSLIHQVSVSFRSTSGFSATRKRKVSIPYSSGQCFFLKQQKLLLMTEQQCFNPLFIRSVFLF